MTNPVTKTDAIFLKHFSIIIGALAAIAIVLYFVAMHIYSENPPPTNPDRPSQVDTRMAPVGAVYAGDTGRAAMQSAKAAAAKAAASQVAYGGTTDGKTIFGNLCHACHETGAGGAPRISDKAAWAPRVAEGIATLDKHAIDGFTGKSGTMPAKGGNPALTDEQVKATVAWMVEQVK